MKIVAQETHTRHNQTSKESFHTFSSDAVPTTPLTKFKADHSKPQHTVIKEEKKAAATTRLKDARRIDNYVDSSQENPKLCLASLFGFNRTPSHSTTKTRQKIGKGMNFKSL